MNKQKNKKKSWNSANIAFALKFNAYNVSILENGLLSP